MKLQKYLQQAGFDSRRTIRKFIGEGQFKVNGTVVQDPNFNIDPQNDRIHFKEKPLKLRLEKKSYFVFNKPVGVVSTLEDPQKRPCIKNFITGIRERVYPVGRLDFHSEGLILLTNDGDLMNFVISPRHKIPKTYLVKIKGILKEEEKTRLQTRGMHVEGIRVKPIRIDFVRKTQQDNSWWQVAIFEGKKHILRNLFKYAGHPVEKLKRIAIGTIKLKKLPPGHWRELTEEEVEQFKKMYHYPK
jgi:pseudouridine synthase